MYRINPGLIKKVTRWKSEDCLVGVRDCYCAVNGGRVTLDAYKKKGGKLLVNNKTKGSRIPSYMLTVAKEYIRSFRQVQQGTLVGSRTQMDCHGKDLADFLLRLVDDDKDD